MHKTLFKTMTNMILVTAFILFSDFISGQDVGTTCITAKNESGECQSITVCQPFLQILRNTEKTQQDIEYIRQSVCSGFDGKYPLSCCPVLPPANPPPNTPAQTTPAQTTPATTTPIAATPVPTTRAPSTQALSRNVRYLLPTSDCGMSNITSGRVVGGVPAKLGEFPWTAALGYRNQRNANQPKWLCGGTLITDKHVLTAAHCIFQRPDLYLARLGDLDLYSDDDGAFPIDIRISLAKYHEQFSLTTFTNDIGILTLSQRVRGQNIHPVCLPNVEPYRTRDYTNEQLYITGWGSIHFNGPANPILQVVMLPVIPIQQCVNAFRNLAVIDDRVLCAGYTTGGRDACKGDSGGPMMYETDQHLTYQIGVISYGIGCAQPGIPAVYTKVSWYLDWIENNLN